MTLPCASIAGVLVVAAMIGACSEEKQKPAPIPPSVTIDGSSTVYIISKDVAERYHLASANPVTVAESGSGAGLKKLCDGNLAIAGASRPINESEMKACEAAGIEFIEIPVAFDGIVVAVHPDNDWVDYLTVAELRKLWEPAAEGKVLKWSDVRASWPAIRIHPVGPGRASGTFDYFTKAIVGKESASRNDYLASEDDQLLVTAIANDGLALGFFGFGYYQSNTNKLKAVPIDDEKSDDGVSGPVLPSSDTIRNARYQPLARPLFIYVSVREAKRPEVDDFVRFYLDVARAAVNKVGYVPLPKRVLDVAETRFRDRVSGSVFASGGAELGVTIDSLYMAETVPVAAVADKK